MIIVIYADKEYRDNLGNYLEKITRYSLFKRDIFWDIYNDEDLFSRLASLRLIDPFKKGVLNQSPHHLEIDFERERILKKKKIKGVVYEGLHLRQLYLDYLPQEERKLCFCHIIITEELFSTYFDGRYHLRTALFGFPNLISLPGIVEAPAKSASYYLYKKFGLEKEGDFIYYGDARLKEVVKLLSLKAVGYHLSKDVDCREDYCCFYDAHTQEDLIRQIEEFRLCPRHRTIMEGIFDEVKA